MSVGRNLLLWASKNEQLKQKLPKYKFVQRAVKRFMPGETASDAIEATKELLKKGIPTTFTHLGENINDLYEAEDTAKQYVDLLNRINKEQLDIEVSLKLTQIGFDLSFDKTLEFFEQIVHKANEYNNNVFIDIEDSSYVDKTISFYREIKKKYDNVGLCLQSYLYRTMDDIKNLLDIKPWIRLVKGAYKEPADVAFPKKSKVDENYLHLAKYLLQQTKAEGIRVAYGTHDIKLQEQIKSEAEKIELGKEQIEFQMLYGIKQREQVKLAEEGYRIRTLISYGKFWYPWYMRRLAERPANVTFVLKNLFGK